MASTTESTTSHSPRLSKSRANTSYSNLLRLAEQQHEPSLRPCSSSIYDSGDQLTSVPSTPKERRGRRATRSKFRAYLHGTSSEKSQAWSSDDEDEEQKGFTDIARGVRDRLSRVGTRPPISQSPSAGASVTQLSNCSSSYLELTLEESARLAEDIKEKAHMDSIAACNHVSSPIDEDLHVDAVQSPIRRKSLYTPGIATRTPNDILQKPPLPLEKMHSQADHNYYFNPNKPESSPLARLAALEIGDGGRSTPSNLDYSHLGGLKLGTLRVTNGTATPVPQETSPVRLHRSTPIAGEHEEFFTASEGNESQDEARRHSNNSLCDAEVYQNPVDLKVGLEKVGPEEQNTCNSHDRGRTRSVKKSLRRGGSPLKYEHEVEEKDILTNPSRKAHSKWLERKQSLPPGFSFESPDQALMNAYDYMKDLPESPFSYAEISSIRSLRAGHTSTSDEGDKYSFEDEGVVISKVNHPEAEMWNSSINDKDNLHVDNGTREDAFRRLNSNATSHYRSVNHPVSSPAVSRNIDRKSTRLDAKATKTMSKADSGYSSSESLKSLGLATSHSANGEDSISEHTQATETRALPYLSASETRVSPFLPKPPKSLKSNLRLSALIIPKTSFVASTPVTNMSPLKGPVITSQPAADPSPRSRSRIRKLTKARRSSQPPPVDSIFVQGIRNLSQIEIPPVPSDVAMKHNERLRRFPLLKHTYPSLHHVNSNDSILSEAPIPMPVEFPSPANSMKRTTSICNTNLDWSPKRSPRSEKKKSRSRSSSKNRSKTDHQPSQAETRATIAEFGTVTESLGNSPYDIARFTTFNPRSSNAASFSNPRRTSSSTPRARSLVRTQEEADREYVEFYNRRSQSCSRDFVQSDGSYESRSTSPGNPIQSRNVIIDSANNLDISILEQAETKKQSLSRPSDNCCERADNRGRTLRTSSRPESMIVEAPPVPALPRLDQPQRIQNFSKPFEPRRKSFDDRGGVAGRLLRPQNIVDVPPMPLLPTKEQLEQREEQIVRSNSSKLKTLPPPVQFKKLTNNLKEDSPKEHETSNWEEKPIGPQGDWELQSKAWSQRRKSAGDALLLRHQVPQHLAESASTDSSSTSSEVNNPMCEAISIVSQEPTNPMYNTRPGPRPISQFQASSSAEGESTFPQPFEIPRKPLATTPKGNIELDRYSGGLSYGYEPGFGLGGSAGTRNMKTGASRKSIHVSRGFGLDLSDVPVFVAPS